MTSQQISYSENVDEAWKIVYLSSMCSLGRHSSRVGVANRSIATFTQKLCSACFCRAVSYIVTISYGTECPIEIEFPSAA